MLSSWRFANLIALGSVLKAGCTTRAFCSFQWRWCLEKEGHWAESERTLRAVVETRPVPSHHSSVSRSVSLCFVSPFHLLHGICESSCPYGLHCVISGLLAGGSPGFCWVLCWFPLSQSLCMAVFVFVAFFAAFGSTAIPIHRMIPRMIQCCHHSSSYRRWTDQLITLPFLFWCVWLFVCFGFACFFCLLWCLFCLCFFPNSRMPWGLQP